MSVPSVSSGTRPTPARATAVKLAVAAVIAMILGTVVPPLIADLRTLVPTGQPGVFRSEPAEARVLHLSALAEREVPPQNAVTPGCTDDATAGLECYQVTGQVVLDRATTTAKAEVFAEVNVDSHLTVRLDGVRVAEITDHSVLDRTSALPVLEPVARTAATVPPLATDVTSVPSYRTGVTHFFPPTSERRSYPYFDLLAHGSTPIDFVDEAVVDGVDAYTYSQNLGAVSLLRAAVASQSPTGEIPEDPADQEAALNEAVTDYSSGPNTLSRIMTGPAERFYSVAEREELGLAADDVVRPQPYYTAERFLTVEPDTGVILDSEETVHVFFALDQREAEAMAERPPHPVRTGFHAQTRWDAETRQAQLELVKPTLRLFRALQIIAWIFTTAAFLLLAATVVTVVRIRAARREQLLAVAP